MAHAGLMIVIAFLNRLDKLIESDLVLTEEMKDEFVEAGIERWRIDTYG